MDIRYYDPKEVNKRIVHKIEPRPGWYPAAYGGVKAEHFTSVEHQEKAKRVHVASKPSINESSFETCVELSILQALPGPLMVFMELGAGWGGQTLTMETAVRNQVVDMSVDHVYSYAVEAEPGHYGFLVEAIYANRMHALPIFGAVGDTLGWNKFYAERPSASNYGQAFHPRGNIEVPTFTVENLMDTFKIGEVDLVHMDVQGAEPLVLAGTPVERFRFLIVCPHYGNHIQEIRNYLEPTHEEIICLGPASGYHEVEGFPLPVHMPQDGIMVWERK